ncbi:transcriptional regulator (MarR family), partial [Candidatus Magnetomorum sp. HK-1]
SIKYNSKEEGISQVELSKHLIVTPSNMTKMIDKLEKEKLVQRSAAKEDRRINMISITERGVSVLGEVWDGYAKCLKDEVKCLNKKEQKLLSDLLIKWFKAI